MMTPPAHPRMRGVMQNNGPNSQTDAPRTVFKVVPMEQFAVFYYDENGVPRTNVLIKVEEKLYFAPQGMEWCQSLKPVAEWLKKGAQLHLGSAPAAQPQEPLPDQDNVDIMGGNDGNPPQK